MHSKIGILVLVCVFMYGQQNKDSRTDEERAIGLDAGSSW